MEAQSLHQMGAGALFSDGRVYHVIGDVKLSWGRVTKIVGVKAVCVIFAITFLVGRAMAAPLVLTPPGISAPQMTTDATQSTTATVSALEKKTHYNVVVLGDSLGDGVWAGLYHALRKDKRFSVIRKSKVATGFVRHDYYDWNEVVREIAADTTIDIAVVIMGTNDRQTIVKDGARYALFDPKWRKVYNARVDDFTETLKATGARVYWVGLPVMRSSTFERDMETFSDIFKTRAMANGVVYLPTHDLLADEKGSYVAYGLDKAGRKRLLRAEDGIHFTMAGYEQLVEPIARAIKHDADGGILTVDASARAVSAAAADADADVVDAGHANVPAVIGLKAQIYDVAESHPGRSDDWRWTGSAH